MTRIQDTRRSALPPPADDAAAAAFLRENAATIRGFRAHRKDGEAFSRFATTSHYGDMMAAVRRAAVALRADEGNHEARALIEHVAAALDVPAPDLFGLDAVPAHLVASGRWRPRSVNVDLIDPDESARLAPESKFQASLNHFSEKVLPKTRAVKVQGLYPAYMVAGAVTPVVGAVGRTVATPMSAAAKEVRGWSDELADEVQLALRRIRDATSASGLKMSDIKKLHPVEQRMMIMTGQALHGMALDAEMFVQWARDPKSVELPKGLAARIKKWASSSLDGLARFLKATASGVKTLTDEDSWRTFSVHAQFGGGVEKFWVSARGGVSLMFPTLEQVQRDGEVVMQVVPRLKIRRLLRLAPALDQRADDVIQFVGIALDNQTVSRMMVTLEESPQLRDVDLDYTKKFTRDGVNLQEFSLSAKLSDPLKRDEEKVAEDLAKAEKRAADVPNRTEVKIEKLERTTEGAAAPAEEGNEEEVVEEQRVKKSEAESAREKISNALKQLEAA